MAGVAVEDGRPQTHETGDDIRFSYSRPEHSFLRRCTIKTVERLSGQPRLRRLYDDWRRHGRAEPFFEAAVRLMGIDVHTTPSSAPIPRQGPVLFVSNHPYGVLDGVALGFITQQIRPETKILTHSLLCQPPELKPHLLPIDFGGTSEARASTLRSRLEAQRLLKSGGAIAIFPGGGVATCQRPFDREAIELPWHPFTAKLARTARATVVPIFFGGQNSRLFQIASHVSYSMRVALLFRETASRLGARLDVVIGAPIDFTEIEHFDDRRALTLELRRRTLSLAQQLRPPGAALPDYRREYQFPSYICE